MLINEMQNENTNIMVYMGPYIKKRSDGNYNDHVTYEENLNADYKSYIDLKTGEVYNLSLNNCQEFERRYTILKPPVISNSYDSYLSNYMKIKTWFSKQIDNGREEEAIEELKEKYEKKLEIDQLRKTKENLQSIELELSKLEEERKKLLRKRKNIQCSCNHKIIVQYQKNNLDTHFHFYKASCLICSTKYSTSVPCKFDRKFKNIIHFDDEEFSDIKEEEKIEIAYNMFVEEREANPEVSDSKIVEIINDKLKNNKDCIKGKTLRNKPELEN